MSERRRINISVDPTTYTMLAQLKEQLGMASVCELLVAMAHILIDRVRPEGERKYDLPDDDGEYIDGLFDDLAHTERQPDGTVPKRKMRMDIDGKKR